MLTCRALQPSRTAILSALTVGLVMISSSQRRPCAIDAISNARFSRVLRTGEIRGAALTLLRSIGRDHIFPVGGRRVPYRAASIGQITIWLRIPLSPVCGPAEAKFLSGGHGSKIPMLQYGLDIWAPKKVMNIEWSDQGELAIVSFRRGAWEDELISAANAVHRQFA